MGNISWVTIVAPVYIIFVDFLVYCLDQQSFFWQRFFAHRNAPLIIAGCRDDIPHNSIPQCLGAWDLVDSRSTTTSHFVPRWILGVWRFLAVPFYIGGMVRLHATGTLDGYFMIYYTNWTFNLFIATYLLGIAVVVADIYRFPSNGKGTGAKRDRCRPHTTTQNICTDIGMNSTRFGNESQQKLPIEISASDTRESNGNSREMEDPKHGVTRQEDEQSNNPSVAVQMEYQHKRTMCSKWGILQKSHLICLVTVAPAELFLSVAYWTTIFDGEDVGNQMFVHTVQNVFPLIDIGLLSRSPFVSSHILFLYIYTTIYVVFMVIYGSITDDWPYSSVTTKPKAIGLYIALPFALAIPFFIYFVLVMLREKLFKKRRTIYSSGNNRRAKSGNNSDIVNDGPSSSIEMPTLS